MKLANRFYLLTLVAVMIAVVSGIFVDWLEFKERVRTSSDEVTRTALAEVRKISADPLVDYFFSDQRLGYKETAQRDLQDLAQVFEEASQATSTEIWHFSRLGLFNKNWEPLAEAVFASPDMAATKKVIGWASGTAGSELHAPPDFLLRNFPTAAFEFSATYELDRHVVAIAVGEDRNQDAILSQSEIGGYVVGQSVLPVEFFRQEARSEWIEDATTIAVGALFLIVSLFWAVQSVTKPFQDIAKQAEKIGAGDYDTPFEHKTNVFELNAMSQTLNIMMAKVRDQQGVLEDKVAERTDALTREIVERTRMERELRESEELFRTLVNSSPVGVFRTDTKGNYLYVNDQWSKSFGLSRELAEGAGWMRGIHPEDRDQVVRDWRHAVVLRGSYQKEFRTIGGDDGIRWVNAQAVPETGAFGSIRGYVGTLTDVTEKKSMERQLVHSQKLEAVGQLTGGIAHDFNNLLQIVQGNLELAQSTIKKTHEAHPYLNEAKDAGTRGSMLTQRLLAFSRKQSLRPEVLNPNDLILGMLKIVERTLGEHIEYETRLPDDLLAIEIDKSALESAILNITLNARAAMAKGGTLVFETRNRVVTENLETENEILQAGKYVEITISDSGIGMPPDILEHAFEPFFTTKDVGKGSGLGLSMVYGFIRQSKGNVTIESESDRGTVVRILLPATEDAAPAVQEIVRETPVPDTKNTGTVLVVEDDPQVRETAVAIIKRFGYATEVAKTGVEALELLKNVPEIDVLFSDVVMPGGLSGFDLAESASQFRSDLKVLLTSGYSEAELNRPDMSGLGFKLLPKPYSIERLADELKSILHS